MRVVSFCEQRFHFEHSGNIIPAAPIQKGAAIFCIDIFYEKRM